MQFCDEDGDRENVLYAEGFGVWLLKSAASSRGIMLRKNE